MWRYVYVATCGRGVRKIGSSNDPEKRMAALRWYYPGPSRIFRVEETWYRRRGDARNIECMAHWYLRVGRTREPKWGGREVFIVQAQTAMAAVERAIKADAGLDWTDLPPYTSFAQLFKAVKLQPRRGPIIGEVNGR